MHDVAKTLADIHQQSFDPSHAWSEQSFAELLVQPGVTLYQQEGALLLVRIAADEMEVLTIAVLPELRRQGIAKSLMEQALEEAKGHGVTSCFLEVDQHNQPAICCYESLGFEKLSIREGYYQSQEGRKDAVVMRCAV